MHLFPYRWVIKKTKFTKDRGTVFSCFSAGGGSSLGYKLAGFDVIGFNEIDKRMAENYLLNNEVKYQFIEPIQDFKNRTDLPEELYNLDILDGSPPCSSFSMSGSRDKFWGKEKKFREGQSCQILDQLFFEFIDLAKKLKPKVIISENVKGILMGKAMSYKTNYVNEIHKAFNEAGYYSQHFLLDASKMGVPQRRERVFFICLRKDLANPFLYQKSIFEKVPKLELNFNETPIKFGEYRSAEGVEKQSERAKLIQFRIKSDISVCDINMRLYRKYSGFNERIVHDEDVCPTYTTSGTTWRYYDGKGFTDKDLLLSSSFPLDYKTKGKSLKYILGMSVPPVMMAQIANQVYLQWLSKLK